ncbi:NAD(P)-dependent oxidoreductase [Mangrovibacterium diazotrophicum]|uniref:D-3-phosphoglycerate dehydrogenase n=1 Tax=Mangrovibacterium diazotrophicum TaxID=1261403 RepID=A0A419VZ16_9BACT|nr:NAD(P)-dependent oxidoreductase [Mangrovibacterium diazotrophicum]RKD88461.1 D-3-phosphoglycerate dehydrogenase [Mangrovibacterium diazotrophicum]
MKRVLIATEKPFAHSALSKISEVIRQSGYELHLLEKYQSKTELLEAVKSAEALIVRSDIVDREVLDAATDLKIVVRAGAGYDNVDTAYAKEKSVVVMNTPGQNSNAVAELAIGLAIYGIREFFSGKSGGELRGRTLGLHGYGYVARNVHRIARAFGMRVIVYTRYSKAQATSEGLEVASSLEELYALSDVVSIHVPARGEHLKSVSMDVLKHLKENAIIVNTARKEVIHEEDLCAFMEERTDVKYLSDITPDCAAVFAEKFAGRYYFTPKKIGAQTEEANTNAGVAAAEQIVSFFENDDRSFQVNK